MNPAPLLRLFVANHSLPSRGAFLRQCQMPVVVALLATQGEPPMPAGRHGRVFATVFAPLDVGALAEHPCLCAARRQVGFHERAMMEQLAVLIEESVAEPVLQVRPGVILGAQQGWTQHELTHAFSQQYATPVPEVPPAVLAAFQSHPWPGNIRELRNAVERCFILGRGERFRVEWLRDHFHLADSLQTPAAPVPQHEPLPARRARARATVEACGGNLAAAARDLRVTRKTLYSWLKREGKQS